MRLVFGLVLVVGVGLASFAVYMAKDYIGAYQAELARERAARDQIVPTVEVVVLNRQVAYGEPISQEDVRPVKWPETAVPEGAFIGIEAVFPEGETELRTALRAMEKDEALLAVKVTEPGEDAGVSSRLTKGMRAFAIRVDVASGVSGFLRPGDRVDVYWSGRLPSTRGGETEQEVTQLIQSGVRLVAVDQIADEDRHSPTIARTVTVEASPLQVAALAQAQNTGRLSLSLLGATDEKVADANVTINQSTLLGIEAEQIAEVQEEEVCTIRTRRGADIIETPIPCTN
ncbi:MAG: Flp pilus assembly protein CpaB [Rhodobacter sp.]|nr:Flp pilus assembly protein CpaB [Rhodobacter sp.]